jgi:hypothetical protein
MQAQHGVAVARILGTDIEHSVTGGQVDGRQEYFGTASLTGSLYYLIAILCKLFAV